jgi:VanZ family protein
MRTCTEANGQPTPVTNTLEPTQAFQPARLAWALLVAGVIFYASSRSTVAAPGFTRIDDKIGHFAVYGLLASLICRAAGGGGRGALIALIAASAYGASDEWHQSFVPGRNCEFADWIADTLGAGLAVALYTWVAPYRRLLEASPWRRRKA